MWCRKRLLTTALVALIAVPASAAAIDLFVSPSGSDEDNDCRKVAAPCRTGSHAVAQVPLSGPDGYVVYLADGDYADKLDVVYQRHVNFIGNCRNPAAVSLRPNKPGAAIVIAQDYAIVGVSCMTITSDLPSGIGLLSRQYAIIDYGNVIFGPLGQHVVVNHAAASCTDSIKILGAGVGHGFASNQGLLTIACPINIPKPIEFQVFVQAGLQSVVDVAGARLSGEGATKSIGRQFSAQDGSISLGRVVLPGDQAGQLFGSGNAW